MPSFFTFQQGRESQHLGSATDTSPLLGRFRAVPQRNSLLLSGSALFGSIKGFGESYIGYGAARASGTGAVVGAGDQDDYGEDVGDGCCGRFGDETQDGFVGCVMRWLRLQEDIWLEPKPAAVVRVVGRWWSRWAVLVGMPAVLAVAWCALPFPQYELPDDDSDVFATTSYAVGHRVPGHGEARVEINFWFFLFVYYGFYNVTALMWITKVFNIYSLNWWPPSLGFPVTVSLIALISILGPIPVYYLEDPVTRPVTKYNTGWICWTFFTMAMPLIIAFAILLNHERHLGLRHSLSETQRIFTSSWWTGDSDTIVTRERPRRSHIHHAAFDPDAPLEVALASDRNHRDRNLALRKRWLPASFVRFIWFCAALFIGMLTYVLGETYAEIYLRTLPHNTFHTIVYVYSWVITVHLLDGLTGWILGGNDGERVGSYPLGWIFKLYFSVTYQTYVRALYARLRSPQQFIYLQVLSSSSLIILAPFTIAAPFHSLLTLLQMNGQTLQSYQKFCARNIFIRSLAENVSMLAFLGSILVLHYGSNKDVYPYFAFDRVNVNTTTIYPSSASQSPTNSIANLSGSPTISGPTATYDFGLTFYASIVTWGCEIVAGWIVRRILWLGWKVDVTGEGTTDLSMWPELLPTGVVVMGHVLQNMLFSIVRLRFH